MRSKITVVGDAASDVVVALRAGDHADVTAVTDTWADVAGSEVVVVTGGDLTAAGRQVARRAPGAVVLVATADAERDCARVLASSLLPRPRVFGVVREDVRTAVEAVVFGRDVALQAAALCRGELGIEDRVATVPVRVGAGGLRSIG